MPTKAFALFRILSNLDTLKTSFRNNANVRAMSANFLHVLDEVGVQARKNQLSEVCTFYYYAYK